MNQNEKRAMEMISVKKVVSTEELCETLRVSESTARRLLVRLAEKSLIRRYHGGGQSLEYQGDVSGIQKRMDLNTEEKDRIALTAVRQIKPGSSVILLGGTTVYKMCKYIKDMHITVITNSVVVLNELMNVPHIDIILLGGRIHRDEMEVHGMLTYTNLKFLHADSLFMGVNSFHPKIGFMTNEIDSVGFYRGCIEAANQKYILTDSTKLSNIGAAVTATGDMVDCLITDAGLDDKAYDTLVEQGVRVIRV